MTEKNMENYNKTAIIIGCGPAGLTAAYELLKQDTEIHPVLFEENDEIGGISRTIKYKDCCIDIGGHRFFSKDERVIEWWKRIMPVQGALSKDDILLGKTKNLEAGGPDPETTDRVMLIRDRVSRIYYMNKFFDYPISLQPRTFINMGFFKTACAGMGYAYARLNKRKETSLEDFFINRFGKVLYEMFFEGYTEKVWGVHPSDIAPDWGTQRIKMLSLSRCILDALKKIIKFDKVSLEQKNTETSLIERFFYPKFGPGQLWETVASEIESLGGEVCLRHKVIGVNFKKDKIGSVTVERQDGTREEVSGDYFLSSMPVKDLIESFNGINVPYEIKNISSNLPYRDFIIVGLLVNKLKIRNKTKVKTIGNIIPDTWIYIQDKNVKIGRLQIFNNWSPYLLQNCENSVWIGAEYFCNENDEMWNMCEKDFISFAKTELEKVGIIDGSDVIDATRICVRKAYPAYFGTYAQINKVRDWLSLIPNLYCIGRNGQHRYNNMDHSMLTGMQAVKLIKNNTLSKASIWDINCEDMYHENKGLECK